MMYLHKIRLSVGSLGWYILLIIDHQNISEIPYQCITKLQVCSITHTGLNLKCTIHLLENFGGGNVWQI